MKVTNACAANLPRSRHRHDGTSEPSGFIRRTSLAALALLDIVGIGAALLLLPFSFESLTPKAAEPERVLTVENARSICMEPSENPKEYLSGALAALIALKLSENAQFRDPAGACKLMETAVISGDQAWRSRVEGCRGS